MSLFTQQKMENLCCSICNDIYREPVILRCSHSFCKDCLHMWWSTKEAQICPLCNQVEHSQHLTCNLVLKNLCEDFLLRRKQEGFEPLCRLHSEKLHLFCMDHQQLACVRCISHGHEDHIFTTAEEAAQHYKLQVLECVEPLRQKQVLLERVKAAFDSTAVSLKDQLRNTEEQIRQQFENLHQFLHDEENMRIAALKSEEQQKSKVMRQKIVDLCRDIMTLSDTIRAAEEETRATDVSFLQNHQQALANLEPVLHLNVPELISGALIDQGKHLGNLTYNIWIKMKTMVSFWPVILDPNTAHPDLQLSEDLTSVTLGEKRLLADNPERFEQSVSALGSEGFLSGFHSWDVEVRPDASWGVGVVKESVRRKGQVETGFWELSLLDGTYSVSSPCLQRKVVSVKKLQKVRVQLDWNRGKLSFFDLDNEKLIYAFKHTFTEKMFPYICTNSKLPLKISPVSITAAVSHSLPLSAGFWDF